MTNLFLTCYDKSNYFKIQSFRYIYKFIKIINYFLKNEFNNNQETLNSLYNSLNLLFLNKIPFKNKLKFQTNINEKLKTYFNSSLNFQWNNKENNLVEENKFYINSSMNIKIPLFIIGESSTSKTYSIKKYFNSLKNFENNQYIFKKNIKCYKDFYVNNILSTFNYYKYQFDYFMNQINNEISIIKPLFIFHFENFQNLYINNYHPYIGINDFIDNKLKDSFINIICTSNDFFDFSLLDRGIFIFNELNNQNFEKKLENKFINNYKNFIINSKLNLSLIYSNFKLKKKYLLILKIFYLIKKFYIN